MQAILQATRSRMLDNYRREQRRALMQEARKVTDLPPGPSIDIR